VSNKIGVLLSNLGTPEAPTEKAVRAYLAEFLSDPRVIQLPKLLWWPILHGIILRTRPKRSAHAYQQVWTEQGSPLLVITQRQAYALQQKLGDGYHVVVGMRYGKPSIADALQQLRAAGVEKMMMLPLYPQFSYTTTQSNLDKLPAKTPAICCYYNDPLYVQALANSVKTHWQEHGQADELVLSFHGLPQAYVDRGDPYYDQCMETSRLLVEALELKSSQYRVTFQSRLGRQKWLQPYTALTMQQLPKEGVKSIQIICPGFSADCLETLEEIKLQNRDFFIQAGGERFEYIPALNDAPEHIAMMVALVQSIAFSE
jgi:ferrochelatase